MISTKLLSLIPLTLALACAAASAAGVYKWTDEDGVVHYSDRPTRDDATEVPGVAARASAEERMAAAAAALGDDAVSGDMLQGLWCEYEMTYVAPGSTVEEQRIEWDFYEGDELQHRDLRSGRRVETTFTVEANEIIPASSQIGTHRILKYAPDQLELGIAEAIHRLRKGGC